MDRILRKILNGIKPSAKERKELLVKVDRVVGAINKEIGSLGIDANCVVGGSVAKDTFLKKDHDCDLFVKFNPKYKDLSRNLSKVMKKFNVDRVHGSRDYFQFRKYGVNFEVVPVLNISLSSEAKNVTDNSPMHVHWVKNFKVQNEIRLAKAFCKGIGVYGAESYIKGFSGHVLDILVVHYGGFLKLLKASSKWKAKTVIDPEKYHKNALKKLNKAKVYSPLIVIDPVQDERNAAAALGVEKFEIFKVKAKEFLKKPTLEFFVRKEKSLKDIRFSAKGKDLILLDIEPKKGKKDVVGAKLLKCCEMILKQIGLSGFTVIESGWNWKRFYFIVKKELLSEFFEREGPPLTAKKNVKMFKSKNSRTFVKGKRVCATIKRKHCEIHSLVKDLIKEKYVREKVKKIKTC
jgi:tRNA nucleotidyltransferase (CCA-adding enzyme)